jgi:elongation factor G
VPRDDAPFAALAFKIATDPSIGNLTFFRVYSGTLRSGDTVHNSSTRRAERVGRLMQMHANERSEIQEVRAGDIAAAVGLEDVTTGDTLAAPEHAISLDRIEFPEPVIAVAVEPKTDADQGRFHAALARLTREDPTFRTYVDADSGQTIIRGMGELHLEIIVDRLQREFGVEAKMGKPQVAYRETIRTAVEQEGKFVRETAGQRQYGHVWLKLEPAPPGTGYEFVDALVDAALPDEFVAAVASSVQEQMADGVVAGYPVVDVKVTLFDGSHDVVDSSEAAFKIAASMAVREGLRRARPVLVEPLMNVEVVTPEAYMGMVNGDLCRRRGVLHSLEDAPVGKIVRARVPLSEMFGYATALRSMSQGRATFTMEFSQYAEVPASVSHDVIRDRAA